MRKIVLAAVLLAALSVNARASWLGRLFGAVQEKTGLEMTNMVEAIDADGAPLTNGVIERKRVFATFHVGDVKHETWDTSIRVIVPRPVTPPPPPVPPEPPVVTNAPPATNSPPVVTNAVVDEVDISGARITSKHKHNPGNIPVTATLNSSRPEGSNVRLSFSGLESWSKHKGEKTTDGGVCILWRDVDGALTGGWFDHHGVGQTVKTMNNIPGGYLDGKEPPPGAEVWFYLVNYEFTKRTNVKSGGNWKTFKLPAGFKLPND